MGAAKRTNGIAVASTALALVAMVFDHLLGDDPGLEDPIAFIVAGVLTLLTTAIVFGVVVPRSSADASSAAKRGFILGLISVVGIVLIWLGVTFVLAGGAIALGLLGRRSDRDRLAIASIVLGTLSLGVSLVFTDWTSST